MCRGCKRLFRECLRRAETGDKSAPSDLSETRASYVHRYLLRNLSFDVSRSKQGAYQSNTSRFYGGGFCRVRVFCVSTMLEVIVVVFAVEIPIAGFLQ